MRQHRQLQQSDYGGWGTEGLHGAQKPRCAMQCGPTHRLMRRRTVSGRGLQPRSLHSLDFTHEPFNSQSHRLPNSKVPTKTVPISGGSRCFHCRDCQHPLTLPSAGRPQPVPRLDSLVIVNTYRVRAFFARTPPAVPHRAYDNFDRRGGQLKKDLN